MKICLISNVIILKKKVALLHFHCKCKIDPGCLHRREEERDYRQIRQQRVPGFDPASHLRVRAESAEQQLQPRAVGKPFQTLVGQQQ